MNKQLIYEIKRCILSIDINVILVACILQARYNSLRVIIFTESIKIRKIVRLRLILTIVVRLKPTLT